MRLHRHLLIAATALLAPATAAAHTPTQVTVFDATTRAGTLVEQLVHGETPEQFVPGARARMAQRAVAPVTIAAGADYLAPTACGRERSTDDTANAIDLYRPKYKVVYAYPADQANRIGQYAPVIAKLVRDAADKLVGASGGALGLRVDQGTECGPQYLDIATVRLGQSLSQYARLGSGVFDAVTRDTRDALGPLPATQKTNVLLFADYLGPATGFGGQGSLWSDDVPGSENLSNSAGNFAVIYGWGEPWFEAYAESYAADAVLHEVTHTLGGVQASAPHASGAGHCNDDWDVMCYSDGGPRSSLFVRCAGDGQHEVYDCGADDYFAFAPTPGSYLDGHWNVRSSVYLCALARCTAPAQRPSARLSGPASAEEGATSGFDASASSDPDGRIVAYRWSAGPGLWLTGSPTGAVASVVAVTAGASYIDVVAVDDEGIESAPARATITVSRRAGSLGDGGPSQPWEDASSSVVTTLDGYSTSWTWSTTEGGTILIEDTQSAGSGADRCRVPNLRGRTLRGAQRALRRAGCRSSVHRWSGRLAGKRVRSQRPAAGTRIRADRTVTFWLTRRR